MTAVRSRVRGEKGMRKGKPTFKLYRPIWDRSKKVGTGRWGISDQSGHLEQPGKVRVGVHKRVIVNMNKATLVSDP